MAGTRRSKGERAVFPGFVPPALATLRTEPPADSQWLHEVKFDGYRLQAHIREGKVSLFTRSGLDWTHRFNRALSAALAALPVKAAVIDGEVIIEADGLPSFPALQEALSGGSNRAYVLYAFDLLHLDGRDLRSLPLTDRRAALAGIMPTPGLLRYSEHFDDGAALLQRVCAIGLEGIISKRRDAPYRSGRGRDWLKVKCSLRQEFIIVGFLPLKGYARAVGALVLGYYEDGKLIYAGRVGTGFTDKAAADLFTRLETMRIPASPLAKKLPRADARGVRFVGPEVIANIEFRGWTSEGLVRHAVFRGVRAT